MNLKFEYFDFIPRKEFEEKANQVLNELRNEIPLNLKCEARCTYFADKFFFQIIFRSENDGEDLILSAQSILDPKKENTTKRGWQIKAIDNMSVLLRRQLTKIITLPLAA